jgi:hypothetical protein
MRESDDQTSDKRGFTVLVSKLISCRVVNLQEHAVIFKWEEDYGWRNTIQLLQTLFYTIF